MLVRCYWCISILIIIPTIRCCSLTGPLCGWSAVVLFDRRYPSFRNFDSTISIDVIRMKSYMDSLFDPTCIPVRVTINKLNFFPNRKTPRFVSVLRNCGGLRTSKPYISVVFFYPVLHRSPCFPDVYFVALTWNLIDDTVLFSWFKGVIQKVLRRCLQQQGVRTVFKSDTTLRSHLVRPKDALEPTKHSSVLKSVAPIFQDHDSNSDQALIFPRVLAKYYII